MRTILVVDDEFDIAETLKSYLEIEGYRAIVAFDGRDALHKAIESKPDLILTDMMMPHMDGSELIARVRSSPAIDGTPIIVMSAVERLEELDVPFFRKPFDPAELVAEIRRQLGEDNGARAS
ncbi:MAG TPA: response regulator [Planctomycetota bacterium]|nr:response regulator [Planctomycetota bacterium]